MQVSWNCKIFRCSLFYNIITYYCWGCLFKIPYQPPEKNQIKGIWNVEFIFKVVLLKFKSDISYRRAHLLYHELIPIISPFVIKSLIVHDRKWFQQQLVVNVYTLTTGTHIVLYIFFTFFLLLFKLYLHINPFSFRSYFQCRKGYSSLNRIAI